MTADLEGERTMSKPGTVGELLEGMPPGETRRVSIPFAEDGKSPTEFCN